MNSGIGKLLAVPVLFLALITAASAPLASPQPAQAIDPLRPASQVIDLEAQLMKAGFAAFKARFVDRREGFRTIKESQAEAVKILEQQNAKAEWWASKGYITADQAAAASRVLDQIAVAMEELAKQERRMVRNDTRFLKTFVQSLGRSLTEAAPQLLAERFGLPPLGARIAGAIIQGEKPATAALDALITKLSGGELVAPSKEPFEGLLKQVDALQEATSALRGADRVKLLGELTGVWKKLEEISGLPIPEQSEELDKLHDFFDEAQGAIGELGKVRDGWVPKYAGASSERFQNNPQWQAIYQEMLDRGESPELVIKAAVAAGMSLAALEKAKAELIAQGIDPDTKDLDLLAAKVIHERILARRSGDPITNEQAVQNVLGGDEPGGSGGGVPASPDDDQPPGGDDPKPGDDPPVDGDNDGDTVPNSTDQCPERPEDFDGFKDFDGCPDDDNDDDAVPDSSDGCPNDAEDVDGFEDGDGCPDTDNDGDGFVDGSDLCPDQAEDINGYEDGDGCPDGGAPDPDSDGITGASDQCPTEAEDFNDYEDSDGCPEGGNPDPDGDGVSGPADQCPDDAEDPDGFQDGDGCPDNDNDGDNIPDTNDQCPDQAETVNGFEDDDGCPDTPPAPVVTNFANIYTGAVCPGVGGAAGFRWHVALSQNGASVTGTISFHKCPGGGRAVYSVSGTATASGTISLSGTLIDGRGPLGGSAPGSQTFSFTIPGAPSPNFSQ